MFKELKRTISLVIEMESVTVDVMYAGTNATNVRLDIMDSLNVLVSLFKLQFFNGISRLLLLVEKPDFRLGACQCSSNGTINCDVYGNCVCREGYTGTKCDLCQSGYSKNASGMCIGMSFCLLCELICTSMLTYLCSMQLYYQWIQ